MAGPLPLPWGLQSPRVRPGPWRPAGTTGSRRGPGPRAAREAPGDLAAAPAPDPQVGLGQRQHFCDKDELH